MIGQRNVSRETLERLNQYEAILRKWTARINLVAPSTLDDLWTRHFEDSLQIFDLVDSDKSSWLDLGSGGGFPGLVVAILADDERPHCMVTLVEADQRKATFLRTVIRELGLSATVLSKRIEALPPQNAAVLSARALAPLADLLAYAHQHRRKDGQAVFHKGANWENEVADAQRAWSFDLDVVKSRTAPDAVILRVGEIARA